MSAGKDLRRVKRKKILQIVKKKKEKYWCTCLRQLYVSSAPELHSEHWICLRDVRNMQRISYSFEKSRHRLKKGEDAQTVKFFRSLSMSNIQRPFGSNLRIQDMSDIVKNLVG